MKQLKTVLLVNALSSAAAGLLFLVLAAPFASLFGITNVLLFEATGVFLLLFAGFVMYAATRSPITAGMTKLVTLLDISWVLASMVVVIEFGHVITMVGSLIILAIAAWVALMALLQYRGLLEMNQRNATV
ncbi:MAG: hypothetical protein J7623_21750 [Chitinophaga sp.]|uniref:hypothetical protein n=1 Tax=Chitinophaga sp. TaxID=1869181 RepID=UPI001B225073|nr:hypothetical protein [Chitinophaga sp.]MBO9731278.1 hypothetical protein [Chitinophaga sp.]